MISSNWKLTYLPGVTGETVVLDVDNDLLEEPEFGFQLGLNIVRIPYGTPFLELTNQDVYALGYTKVFYAATDALARRDMMRALLVQYRPLGKVPLKLEVSGLSSEVYNFTDAAFANPRVRRLNEAGKPGLEAAWSLSQSITAVGGSRVVV